MMFKTCFSNIMCLEQSASDTKKLCDKFGIDGVEVRTLSDNGFTHGEGLNVVDVGSSFCIKEYNEEQIRLAKQLLDEICKENIRGMRVFLGNFSNRYSSPEKSFNHEGIVKALKELCRYSGTEIWVETHNEYSAGKVLKKLIADVDEPNLKIIWDIIHPIEVGEMPEETWGYIGEYITHIHLKDGKKARDPDLRSFEYTKLGDGELPLRNIFELLKSNRYDGYISLEWENIWRSELENMNLSTESVLQMFIQCMKENA